MSATMDSFDPETTLQIVEATIQDCLHKENCTKAVIGLSGGLDSAVLAAIARRAVGESCVYAIHFYDTNASDNAYEYARLLADYFGLYLDVRDVNKDLQKAGIYTPGIVRLTQCAGFLNRYCLNYLHKLLTGETPFFSSLRREEDISSAFKRYIIRNGVGRIVQAVEKRHRFLRQYLEEIATEQEGVPLGAANRSEHLTGWFVKGGIDDLPYSPLINLFKSHVQELAEHLNLPAGIRNRAPSPGMIKGITDESGLNLDYQSIDLILSGLESGATPQNLTRTHEVTYEEIEHVKKLYRLSEWKRNR